MTKEIPDIHKRIQEVNIKIARGEKLEDRIVAEAMMHTAQCEICRTALLEIYARDKGIDGSDTK